jgi:hypothetical protein
LLQELSVLKALDSHSPTSSKTETEQRLNQQRQQEIITEIKALAEQKKNNRITVDTGEWALGSSEA